MSESLYSISSPNSLSSDEREAIEDQIAEHFNPNESSDHHRPASFERRPIKHEFVPPLFRQPDYSNVDFDEIEAEHQEIIDRINTQPESFTNLDIAELIYDGEMDLVMQHIDSLINVDQTAIMEAALVYSSQSDISHYEDVYELYNHLKAVDYRDLADRLKRHGNIIELVDHLELFPIDTDQLAIELVNNREYTSILLGNLDKFRGLDHDWLADQLISSGRDSTVLQHIESFPNVDQSSLVWRLFEEEPNYRFLERAIGRLNNLSSDIANHLLDNQQFNLVATHLDKFPFIRREYVANRLIAENQWTILANNISEFESVDRVLVADKLIIVAQELANARDGRSKLYWETLAKNINQFPSIDKLDLANMLINSYPHILVENLHNFPQQIDLPLAQYFLDASSSTTNNSWAYGIVESRANHPNELAAMLLQRGPEHCIGAVTSNLDNFPDLTAVQYFKIVDGVQDLEAKITCFRRYLLEAPEDIQLTEEQELTALEYIIQGPPYHLITMVARFRNLDTNMIVEKLAQAGYGAVILDNLDKFPGHQPTDKEYGEASFTKIDPGFSKSTIGSIIRTRIETGLEQDVHDASQWLSEFMIPQHGADIANLKQRVHDKGSAEVVEIEYFNSETEVQFLAELLQADLDLRQRLTYGTRTTLDYRDKLELIFAQDKSAKGHFNSLLGQSRSTLTKQFHQQLLDTDPQLRQAYEDETSQGIKPKKFFADRLTPEQSAELNELARLAQAELEKNYLEQVLNDNPNLEQLFAQNETGSGEGWFYNPAASILFQAATSPSEGGVFYKQSDFNLDTLREKALELIPTHVQHGFGSNKEEFERISSQEELVNGVNEICREIKNLTGISSANLSQDAARLRQMMISRDQYIHDTQTWLSRHATTKAQSITQAWGDRPLALSNGVKDGALEIIKWQRKEGLKESLSQLSETGELENTYGLTVEEVLGEQNADNLSELLRSLSSRNTIKAMSMLKKWQQHEWTDKLLPAQRVVVTQSGNSPKSKRGEVEYSLEILPKDDPRGFTIGEDTGCCMTISGESKDCIRAGYTKQNAGFLAVYQSNGELLAQSFWFINPVHPDTLVVDNIEANEGRDKDRIATIYHDGLAKYLEDHPELGITKVHVGTGYSSISLDSMPYAPTVPPLEDVGYSDAHTQRLLLDMNMV